MKKPEIKALKETLIYGSYVKSKASQMSADTDNIDVVMCIPDNIDVVTNKPTLKTSIISAKNKTGVAGSSFMIIPFVICFFMILSVMIGTVHERAKEINTFSSVGLAPGHVALMFLIEAIVYAAIASVLGYFMGIALLYAFRIYGLLPENFYPNYLGIFVLYAIGLAMFATISSSLYPMRVAARMANPSGEKEWVIAEEPTEDTWFIKLPFIASQKNEVMGICCFIGEFVGFHSGEGVGDFVAQGKMTPTEHSKSPYAIKAPLWLSPFERGINMECTVLATNEDGRWCFAVDLLHTSGPRHLWLKSTRMLLDAIRKQMLVWRALSPEALDGFINKGSEMFGQPEQVAEKETENNTETTPNDSKTE